MISLRERGVKLLAPGFPLRPAPDISRAGKIIWSLSSEGILLREGRIH